MDIRIRIDQLRIKNGWSKSKLAEELGISYTALKNWYNDKNHMPSLRVIEEASKVFKMSKAQLFADCNIDKLNENQIALLELFDQLTEKQQKNVIEIIKNLI